MAPGRAEVEAQVAAHPFFAGMSAHYIRLLADCAIATRFGKIVLEAGENAGCAPVIIDRIGAGDLLGWSWIFPPYIWHFTARAVELTNSIFFYGTILREYCDKDSALGYELFKRMSEVMIRRLQGARSQLLEAMVKTRPKG